MPKRKAVNRTDAEILASLAEWAKKARENYHMEPLADALDDTLGLIGRLTLRWSSERPKVAGDYLVRLIGDDRWYAVKIDTGELALDDIAFAGYEYAGPIAGPLEQEVGG